MASVIVSHIPSTCIKEDLLHHFGHTRFGGGNILHVLHPLGHDNSQALVTFKREREVASVLVHNHKLHGISVKVRPAPRQTYNKCTAEVDPVVWGSISNGPACVENLCEQFGLEVDLSSRGTSLSLTGSLLQIQSAQIWLDDQYRKEQRGRQRALLEVGRHVNIPPSDVESSDSEKWTLTGTRGTLQDPWIQSEGHSAGRLRHSKADATGSAHFASKPYSSRERGRPTDPVERPGGQLTGPYSKNEEAVDNMFASSGRSSARHPCNSSSVPWHGSSRETLTASLPSASRRAVSVRAVVEPDARSGRRDWDTRDSGAEKATLDLDSDITNYVRKVESQKIAELEMKHKVKCYFYTSGDVSTVTIATLGHEAAAYLTVDKAKENFISVYQTVFYAVVKETIEFDPFSVTADEYDAVLNAVRKAFSRTVVARGDRSRGEITLVGEWNQLALALDWIKEKLGLKQVLGPRATREQGLRSQYIPGTDTEEPKVMLMMAPSKAGAKQAPHKTRDFGGSASYPGRLTGARIQTPKGMSHTLSGAGWKAGQGVTPKTIRPVIGALMTDETHAKPSNKYVERVSRPSNVSVRSADVNSGHDDNCTVPDVRVEFQTRGGPLVKVCEGNIAMVTADVIVNAADENLHNCSGVARALCEAAGDGFQQSCTQYIAKYGSLKVGEVCSLRSSGALRCANVINAVGPMWCLYTDKEQCVSVLRQTFLQCLVYADSVLSATSIALPAISTGVYGVPLDVCGRALLDVVQQFSRAATTGASLKEILLVVWDQESVALLANVFQELIEFGEETGGYESDKSSIFPSDDHTVIVPVAVGEVEKGRIVADLYDGREDYDTELRHGARSPRANHNQEGLLVSTGNIAPEPSTTDRMSSRASPASLVSPRVPTTRFEDIFEASASSSHAIRSLHKMSSSSDEAEAGCGMVITAQTSSSTMASLPATRAPSGGQQLQAASAASLAPKKPESAMEASALGGSKKEEEVGQIAKEPQKVPIAESHAAREGLVGRLANEATLATTTMAETPDDGDRLDGSSGSIEGGTSRSRQDTVESVGDDMAAPESVHEVKGYPPSNGENEMSGDETCVERGSTVGFEQVFSAAGGSTSAENVPLGQLETNGAQAGSEGPQTSDVVQDARYVEEIIKCATEERPEEGQEGVEEEEGIEEPSGSVANQEKGEDKSTNENRKETLGGPVLLEKQHAVQQEDSEAIDEFVMLNAEDLEDCQREGQSVAAGPRMDETTDHITVEESQQMEEGVHRPGNGEDVDMAETDEDVKSAEKADDVDSAEKEEDVNSAEKEDGVDLAEKEEGVDLAENEEGVDSAENEEDVYSAEKEEDVDSAEKEEGVNLAENEEGVDSAENEEDVDLTENEEDVEAVEGKHIGKDTDTAIDSGGEPVDQESHEDADLKGRAVHKKPQQPSEGVMLFELNRKVHIPGEDNAGAILITYKFPAPQNRSGDVSVSAYLPNSPEGREVLQLLRIAFDEGWLFDTIEDGGVDWAGVEHKTDLEGGPETHGYPDPDYLARAMRQLAERGITPDQLLK